MTHAEVEADGSDLALQNRYQHWFPFSCRKEFSSKEKGGILFGRSAFMTFFFPVPPARLDSLST